MTANQSMYFNFTASSRRIQRILNSIGKLRESIIHEQTKSFTHLMLEFVVGALLLSYIFLEHPESMLVFAQLSLFALFYIIIYLLLRGISNDPVKNPNINQRLSSSRWASFLTIGGIILFAGYYSVVVGELSFSDIYIDASSTMQLFWGALGMTALAWCCTSLMKYWRYKNVIPQEFEMEYLSQLLQPILSELSDQQKCSLSFNPYSGLWTDQFTASPKHRSGYSFPTYRDTLLRFRTSFPNNVHFLLSINYQRMHKIKNRKNKFKGTKHRIRYVYKFKHSPVTISATKLEHLEQTIKTQLGAASRTLAQGTLPADSKAKINNPWYYLGKVAPVPSNWAAPVHIKDTYVLNVKLRKNTESITAVISLKVTSMQHRDACGHYLLDPRLVMQPIRSITKAIN
jgi:hypothetical protein